MEIIRFPTEEEIASWDKNQRDAFFWCVEKAKELDMGDTPEALEIAKKIGKVLSGDCPESFFAFYELIFPHTVPDHVKKWVICFYEAKEKGLNILLEAFRGSTKSATVIGFCAYRMGKDPEKSNLIIASGDDDANEIA